MNILVTLLGHAKVKDILVSPNSFDVLLTNNTTIKGCFTLSESMLSIPQPSGGNRIYKGTEQSFDHCFKNYERN